MKRIYIAIGIVLIGVIYGCFTNIDIQTRTDRIINNIKEVEKYVTKKELDKATEKCKKTADEFKNSDSKIMYSYYVHKDLAEIEENLYSMYGYIRRKDVDSYYHLSDITKGKLKAIADKEPITVQNVL